MDEGHLFSRTSDTAENHVFPFPEKLRESLIRVVDRAVADYDAVKSAEDGPLSAPEIELAGAEVVRQALATLGYEVSLSVEYGVWELHSEDLSAGWVDSPTDVQDAL